MKRGFIICLLVFGLTYAAEDNIGAETNEANSKAATNNINFRFFDKNKRGATKLTNADSPSFNHLTASNAAGSTVSSSSSGFKPTTGATGTLPFRYVYNQQYYQPNPYLTFVQVPQAAQIAAQYSIQSNPVAHYLQTPNQIQYVAAPTVAQVPQIKFQSFSNEYQQSAQTASSDSATSSATSSQYVPQQTAVTSSYVPSASSGAAASSSAAVSSAKVQVPFYSGYQTAQPVYYTQQPLLTYYPQAQAANFFYQHPNANLLLKQQQVASLYGGNRFGLYTQTPNAQLTYLVPMVVSQPEQDPTSTNPKSSDKAVSNTQQSAASNTYAFGAKA